MLTYFPDDTDTQSWWNFMLFYWIEMFVLLLYLRFHKLSNLSLTQFSFLFFVHFCTRFFLNQQWEKNWKMEKKNDESSTRTYRVDRKGVRNASGKRKISTIFSLHCYVKYFSKETEKDFNWIFLLQNIENTMDTRQLLFSCPFGDFLQFLSYPHSSQSHLGGVCHIKLVGGWEKYQKYQKYQNRGKISFKINSIRNCYIKPERYL